MIISGLPIGLHEYSHEGLPNKPNPISSILILPAEISNHWSRFILLTNQLLSGNIREPKSLNMSQRQNTHIGRGISMKLNETLLSNIYHSTKTPCKTLLVQVWSLTLRVMHLNWQMRWVCRRWISNKVKHPHLIVRIISCLVGKCWKNRTYHISHITNNFSFLFCEALKVMWPRVPHENKVQHHTINSFHGASGCSSARSSARCAKTSRSTASDIEHWAHHAAVTYLDTLIHDSFAVGTTCQSTFPNIGSVNFAHFC